MGTMVRAGDSEEYRLKYKDEVLSSVSFVSTATADNYLHLRTHSRDNTVRLQLNDGTWKFIPRNELEIILV